MAPPRNFPFTAQSAHMTGPLEEPFVEFGSSVGVGDPFDPSVVSEKPFFAMHFAAPPAEAAPSAQELPSLARETFSAVFENSPILPQTPVRKHTFPVALTRRLVSPPASTVPSPTTGVLSVQK